jgi:chemotaxis signal transduction protein
MQKTARETMENESTEAGAGTQKYLLFRLGGELYGTPLLEVREVVEPHPVKPVPASVPHFIGVANLRGQIVGVIDLPTLLRTRGDSAGKEAGLAWIVFETAIGPMAARVDAVEAVSEIEEKNIEREPQVQVSYPLDFLVGIARHKEELAHLIQFARLLSAEELKRIKGAKK